MDALTFHTQRVWELSRWLGRKLILYLSVPPKNAEISEDD